MNSDLTEREMIKCINGTLIGSSNGSIVCGSCGERIDTHDDILMTGYVGSPMVTHNQWELVEMYCSPCNKRSLDKPTLGIGEFMVEFKPVTLGGAVCLVVKEILDHSSDRQGTRY